MTDYSTEKRERKEAKVVWFYYDLQMRKKVVSRESLASYGFYTLEINREMIR